MKPQRQRTFQRNQDLEQLLKELNRWLGVAEESATADVQDPEYPVLFVVGPPRSGTTIVTQWLSGTGLFSYPSNLLSRFYGAPYMGALVQRLLADPNCQYGEELADMLPMHGDWSSSVGKTKGALQPNEFWYFWRRFIPNDQPRKLSPEEEREIDWDGFRHGFASIEKAFGKPMVLKGIILQYNLTALAAAMPKAIFIHTVRHPFYNVQSLLEARVKYYGDIKHWFSVQPPEYEELLTRNPYEQVAGQVHFTNESIAEELAMLPEHRWLRVEYERFCEQPDAVYEELRARLGCDLDAAYRGPEAFRVTNIVRMEPEDVRKIQRGYQSVSGSEIAP